VDDLVKAMGMTGISKSQVSRLCGELDERVGAFMNRPIEGDWPYLWIDATYVKAREALLELNTVHRHGAPPVDMRPSSAPPVSPGETAEVHHQSGTKVSARIHPSRYLSRCAEVT
jgi:hypothetical protein